MRRQAFFCAFFPSKKAGAPGLISEKTEALSFPDLSIRIPRPSDREVSSGHTVPKPSAEVAEGRAGGLFEQVPVAESDVDQAGFPRRSSALMTIF
jgi:hypothetical protein